MANIQELSESSFETEVLSSAKPVLVDFWAPWCGPCRRIAPLLEQFALENAEAVKVVKSQYRREHEPGHRLSHRCDPHLDPLQGRPGRRAFCRF